MNESRGPNWYVKSFTKIFLNIMINFILNEIIRFTPRDPPWINSHLNTMLKRNNRLFKNKKDTKLLTKIDFSPRIVMMQWNK